MTALKDDVKVDKEFKEPLDEGYKEREEILDEVKQAVTVMDEETLEVAKKREPYGYIGTRAQWESFRESDGKKVKWRRNCILNLPSGTKRIKIRITPFYISFSKYGPDYPYMPDDHHYNEIVYYADLYSFDGSTACYEIGACLRDFDGKDEWWAEFKVEVDCYGPIQT